MNPCPALPALVLAAAAVTANAQTPPAIRSLDASRAESPIRVDGLLTEGSWAAAQWTQDFGDIRGEAWPTPTWRTRAKLLWDDEYLYFAAWLEEPHLWATLTARDAIIYRDNDWEIFIDPDGDQIDYAEFVPLAVDLVQGFYARADSRLCICRFPWRACAQLSGWGSPDRS